VIVQSDGSSPTGLNHPQGAVVLMPTCSGTVRQESSARELKTQRTDLNIRDEMPREEIGTKE